MPLHSAKFALEIFELQEFHLKFAKKAKNGSPVCTICERLNLSFESLSEGNGPASDASRIRLAMQWIVLKEGDRPSLHTFARSCCS